MLSVLLPNLFLFPMLKKNIKIKKYKIDIKPHLRPIFDLFIPSFAYTIYAVVDKTMIKFITDGTTEVGYYEQAYKVAFIGITIISVFSTVISSRVSAMKSDSAVKKIHETSYPIIFIIALPMLIGFFILSDYFIPTYYGVGYEGSIAILKVFSVFPLINGLSTFIGHLYLFPKLITKPIKIIITSSVFINTILNVIFINKYGGLGAAIATIISESFITFCYLMLYLKFQKMSTIFRCIYKYLISGIVCFILVFIINYFMPCTSLIIFIFYVLLIISLFIIVLLFLKDKFVLSIINSLKNKIRRYKNV
jgi:O-antigen/teichoic acid export membrane protein